ncbi:hypothetical protein [Streptomyces sp. UNOB3_S3]|uniref:hypothetical protein n=1 Tax=Streptomyces sp. UNOB3_S3 TaxID=2871682 RepID=UPI001E497DEB|nr:hypothetical protein [Streptomyces sp. UNOB3_S3]MCC3776864.1 hypothetical protein [Streptomyces sp. UNOB3_S3]
MAFRIGDIVVDTRSGRIGQLMGREGPDVVQLRPVRGGIEWDCPVSAIRCAVCVRIKDERREAEALGDTRRMGEAATRMGVHQRQAH